MFEETSSLYLLLPFIYLVKKAAANVTMPLLLSSSAQHRRDTVRGALAMFKMPQTLWESNFPKKAGGASMGT